LIELLLISCPLVFGFSLIYCALYYLSMDIPILLISVLPAQSRNFFTVGLCLIWNTLNVFAIISWSLYTFVIIVSFVITFKDAVDSAMKIMLR